MFDLECITPWLKLNSTCPLDRTDILSKSKHAGSGDGGGRRRREEGESSEDDDDEHSGDDIEEEEEEEEIQSMYL